PPRRSGEPGPAGAPALFRSAVLSRGALRPARLRPLDSARVHRGEHYRAAGRGHRDPARAPGARAGDALRRLLGRRAGAGVCRDAPSARCGDDPARGLPRQPRRGRLVSRRPWEARAAGLGGPGPGRRSDLLRHYHGLVGRNDAAAAGRWLAYEEAVMRVDAGEGAAAGGGAQDPTADLARARVQLHYLAHGCFLHPGELLGGLARLGGTRALIVQGGRDLVCPPRTAIELAGRLPRAELRLVQDGGHSATGPEMAQAL